ncbi:hypothetical protein Q1695_011997 [Nippostrongylus brasiliensis]|nr:hypothetical protein Q1695_011997 [Nippostrongylus brasiliensis]
MLDIPVLLFVVVFNACQGFHFNADGLNNRCRRLQYFPYLCVPTTKRQLCPCRTTESCNCLPATVSCPNQCFHQCSNSCQMRFPLCQITCGRTCASVCRNSESAAYVTPLPILTAQPLFQTCSADCTRKCQYDCLSRQFGTTQCSTSCQESCGRVCSRTPLPVKPVQVPIKLGQRAECLSSCGHSCENLCYAAVSPSQCRFTCNSNCRNLCPEGTPSTSIPQLPLQALQSPFLQQPETKNSPLKINIELTGDKYDSSPAQLADVSWSTQCLQQCDIGCQQSCNERKSLPTEGCSSSCSSTCNHVCAPAKPSQMIVKDVATYPVRLDPVQRCAAECQSVCQMACKRQISQASCIDACAPQCDRACTSPQVQKNSADLFARSPLHDSSPEHDDESLSSKSAVEIPLKVYIKMADQQEPTTVR